MRMSMLTTAGLLVLTWRQDPTVASGPHPDPDAQRDTDAAAAAHPAVDPGQAVAVVATMGYTGFLAGPPVIGGLAQLTDLRWALLVVVGLLLAVTVLARRSGLGGVPAPAAVAADH